MAAAGPVWHQRAALPGAGHGPGALPGPSGPWLRAARCGPGDSVLARAGLACFEAADAALGRLGAPAAIRRQVTDFADAYVLRGRCPADDMLEESR